jgi:hypothetical protein
LRKRGHRFTKSDLAALQGSACGECSSLVYCGECGRFECGDPDHRDDVVPKKFCLAQKKPVLFTCEDGVSILCESEEEAKAYAGIEAEDNEMMRQVDIEQNVLEGKDCGESFPCPYYKDGWCRAARDKCTKKLVGVGLT